MLFCIIFNYTALRALKDTLVIPTIGAEAISFIKLWGVLPSAVLFMVLYAKLLNIFGDEKVFYVVAMIFISFFALFGLLFYPYQDLFHPSQESVQALAASFPFLKWFFFIYGKWSYAIFYIFSELWGSVMLSLLFWQFANKVTSTQEAKRFYAMFGVIGNLASFVAGTVIKSFIKPGEAMSIDSMLVSILTVIIAFGFGSMIIYKWLNKVVLADPRFAPQGAAGKKKKAKLPLKESFKVIFSSKYLGLIVLLVLCYGVSINLVEGPWKSKIRELHPTQEGYLRFMAGLQQWMGIVSTAVFIIRSNILRLFSWFTAAIITPIMILVTGIGFFVFTIFGGGLDGYIENTLHMTPLALAVMLGLIQNVLSKTTKYALFDSTKEMAYIPIDDELKTKGKAAVDVVGGRLGKSGGAFIQSMLFTVFHTATYETISPYLGVIFLLIILVWLYAVSALNKEYMKFKPTN
jgi:AAA family ATP:ADP antiporter